MGRTAAHKVLTRAVRPAVMLKYTAQLALVQALLMLVPVAVGVFYGEYATAWRFALAALLVALLAAPWVRLPISGDIQSNEAISVAAFSFMIGAAAMIYPFMSTGISFIDSLFEAVSGITTTGLSTLAGVEHRPKTFLFARAWMQWYGGLGFVVLSLALLVQHSGAFRRLIGAGPMEVDFTTGLRRYTRHVIVVYLLLTLFLVAALLAAGGDPFAALVHALSAVSTGGFSSYDNSLAGFDTVGPRIVITLGGLLGAVSLSLYYRAWQHGVRGFLGDPENAALLGAVALVCVLLALLMPGNGASASAPHWMDAVLLGVSAQTTTGFSGTDVAQLDAPSKLLLAASMTLGGEVGSTAGGIKLLRLLILLNLLLYVIRLTALPRHAVIEPRLRGQRIENNEIIAVLNLLAGFGLIVLLSWLAFLVYGYDPMDALFDVVSAASTTGLSAGVVGPDLPGALKAVLCFDMLAGRLEVIALLVLMYPGTWFGKRA